MSVRITTLSENTALLGFLAEWGLSILVETDDCKVLLDTGMSISAVRNAQLLGIDLSSIDAIVLSHAHGDHTGGLREVLRVVRKEIQVVAHPDIWIPKYVQFGDMKRYAGMSYVKEDLEALGAYFNLSREPVKISEQIMTTGEINITTDYEDIDDRLKLKVNDELIPDTMTDDLALVVRTDIGLAIITGCAHRGIINTVRHVQDITGGEYIHTIIGGTHLHLVSQERIQKTAEELQQLGLLHLGVSHCTGFNASCTLAQEFGDIFFLNNAGTQITLE